MAALPVTERFAVGGRAIFVRMVWHLLSAWLLVPASASAQDAAAPRQDVRDVAVISGRVERLDPFTRSVVLMTTEGQPYSIYVGRELKIFDELKRGDAVTVRVTESVVVALRPKAKTTAVEDRTTAAGKSAREADVIQQLTAIVTVENVDAATRMITYKGADNRSVVRMVANPRLIDGLKRGDTIEITYTRASAIALTKNR
jgi:hypothetical protein